MRKLIIPLALLVTPAAFAQTVDDPMPGQHDPMSQPVDTDYDDDLIRETEDINVDRPDVDDTMDDTDIDLDDEVDDVRGEETGTVPDYDTKKEDDSLDIDLDDDDTLDDEIDVDVDDTRSEEQGAVPDTDMDHEDMPEHKDMPAEPEVEVGDDIQLDVDDEGMFRGEEAGAVTGVSTTQYTLPRAELPPAGACRVWDPDMPAADQDHGAMYCADAWRLADRGDWIVEKPTENLTIIHVNSGTNQRDIDTNLLEVDWSDPF